MARIRLGNCPKIPVLIDGIRVFALVDSGSDISGVSTRLVSASRLAKPLQPPRIESVGTFSASGTNESRGSVSLNVRTTTRDTQWCFEVFQLPDDMEVLIGTDLMPTLGISIQGLPVSYPGDVHTPGEDYVAAPPPVAEKPRPRKSLIAWHNY
jgi:hypothetical protein